jgi:hypothetical protein
MFRRSCATGCKAIAGGSIYRGDDDEISSRFWGTWEGKKSIVGVFSFFDKEGINASGKLKYGVIMAQGSIGARRNAE